jgi:hypothetical protein
LIGLAVAVDQSFLGKTYGRATLTALARPYSIVPTNLPGEGYLITFRNSRFGNECQTDQNGSNVGNLKLKKLADQNSVIAFAFPAIR